jgi:NAD(P)-dependent dehydrogenase (short-subunit alcohol dehydrogenase family)
MRDEKNLRARYQWFERRQFVVDLQLKGKLALVSGSTAGIGLAIGSSLAGEGAAVIINGRSERRVDDAIATIRQKHPQAELEAYAGDLSKADTVQRVAGRFAQVDILVNNLGSYEPKPFEAISDQDWHAIIETNFMSGVRLSRYYLPRMKAINWGRIIFISSESAINIPVEMIHYGVTKTMQLALARGLAETTAGTRVTVNSVLAGPTRSEGVEQFLNQIAQSRGIEQSIVEKEFFETIRPGSLLKRFASTDEVASLVTFIASPLSAATNGAALRVDGGVVRSIF